MFPYILLISYKRKHNNCTVEIKLNLIDEVQVNLMCLLMGCSKKDTIA